LPMTTACHAAEVELRHRRLGGASMALDSGGSCFERYRLFTSLITGIMSPKALPPDSGQHVEHENLQGFHNTTRVAGNDSASLVHRKFTS